MRSMIAFLFVLFAMGCQSRDNNQTENPYDTTANRNNGPEQLSAREREFVDDVIEDNNEEIAWLHAAVKSGTDAELKDHAQQMLADHEKMDNEIRALAKNKGVEIEEADTVTTILDINEDDPADWDEEWSDEMADKHRKLIRQFERAENYVDDAELKALVTNSLPTLRSHLDMTTKLEEKLDKN